MSAKMPDTHLHDVLITRLRERGFALNSVALDADDEDFFRRNCSAEEMLQMQKRAVAVRDAGIEIPLMTIGMLPDGTVIESIRGQVTNA